MCDWNVPSRVNCDSYGVGEALGVAEADSDGPSELLVRLSMAEQPVSARRTATSPAAAARRGRVRVMRSSPGGSQRGSCLEPAVAAHRLDQHPRGLEHRDDAEDRPADGEQVGL